MTIDSHLRESRSFPPPANFAEKAHVKNMDAYHALAREAEESPEQFWGAKARELLAWRDDFGKVLEWQAPHAKWFVGGKLNVSENCLDRHVATWRKNKAAIIWEGEPGDTRTLTYGELHREVCLFANGLKSLGLVAGDRVTIYMPLTPELAIAVLACARIGAVHSVVFGGFSSEAIAERNNDAKAKVLITADGGWRRGHVVPLKENVDQALTKSPTVERVVILKRTGNDVAFKQGRDVWWHELVRHQSPVNEPEAFDSEHPLFILYTSGSTGKPKGILHTSGGYLLGATLSSKLVFDLKDEDIFWCTADIGWVTGHSYVVYGPLSNGATVMMYEGAPNFPDWGRFWRLIEKHRVNTLYTAPTAIRAFMKQGDDIPAKSDLSSLRLLGTVGEPINPEAWLWYQRVIGGGKCPIVDTWWQTETGSIMISPIPGATTTVPGSATRPFLGVAADIVDKSGNSLPPNQGGFLVIRKPWPSMLRTIYGDDQRFQAQYWSQIPGVYFTGDGARRDENGNFWIMGRIDDVINVSGHRLSTMEIESALVSHPAVAEAAVVGAPHELKGEAIHCFVVLRSSHSSKSEALRTELAHHVAHAIGSFARPESIRLTDGLPKTRSGKIMRRLLRDIASGKESVQDTTTLEDLAVLAKLREDED